MPVEASIVMCAPPPSPRRSSVQIDRAAPRPRHWLRRDDRRAVAEMRIARPLDREALPIEERRDVLDEESPGPGSRSGGRRIELDVGVADPLPVAPQRRPE